MSKHDLQNIAASGSVADKAQLVDALGALYLVPDDVANPRERTLMFEILRHVIHDVEMQVRRKLALQLADKSDPPHDLILMLANDVIEVAFSILKGSPILTDEDLLAIIIERASEYRDAIAGREIVSEPVCESIVATGDGSAVATLLNNTDARFAAETLGKIVDLTASEPDYQELMISRKDLPGSIASRLYEQVSDVLRAYLVETHTAVASELDVALSDAVERALEEDQESAPAHIGAPDWADAQLPIAMVHALEKDDFLHFEDLFQRLTDLAPSQVSRALYDLGMEGLAIACKAVELDRDIFGKIFCRLHGQRPLTRFRESAKFASGMAYYDALQQENAKKCWKGRAPKPLRNARRLGF